MTAARRDVRPAIPGSDHLVRIVSRVPLGFPHFWRAALASLGEPMDFDAPVPEDLGPT